MKLKPITDVARTLGIGKKYLELYGEYKAKVSTDILASLPSKVKAKYIVVTGITPTHLGEGKTVTTIGLSMALKRAGKKAVATIRQPSLGPFFGVKGGGVGGGRAQGLPADDISLHFTGDIHAVEAAHNLIASFLDNSLFRGNRLNIDLDRIFWNRVIDINDRSLRSVRIGVGGGECGVERSTRFDITAASELMAILALADSISDLRKRVSRIVVALTRDGKAVTCEDLKVAGSVAALLSEAIKPNLAQTSEGTPCFIHTGPFANITHGNSSILADKIALKTADFVVTESGFGADCGAEKFFNIKCRAGRLKPDAAVIVCSIRALKVHAGLLSAVPGKDLDKSAYKENVSAVEKGCSNLRKQIENIRRFGVPCIVAINRFDTDTDREIAAVKEKALEAGASEAAISRVYKYGSKGGMELASAVIKVTRKDKCKFKYLYPLDAPIKKKIEIIAKEIYGAKRISLEPKAEEDIAIYERLGFGGLPICMAKTHLSLSHDPHLKGAPSDFIFPIRDVRPSIGAGFLYALCGKTLTMPGLPSHPIGEKIDIDSKGRMRYVHR